VGAGGPNCDWNRAARTAGPCLGAIRAFCISVPYHVCDFDTASAKKKAREHDALLKQLKIGDRVSTNGGIIGVVVGLKDNKVSIRSADTKLEMLKGAITEVLKDKSSSES